MRETNKARIFLAYDLPTMVKSELRSLEQKNAKIRWQPSAQYHLTVYFVGDATTAQINNVITSVKEITANLAPIPVKISNIGVERGNMIWARGHDQTGALSKLYEALKQHIWDEHKLGDKPPRTRLTPHILLGKSRQNAALHEEDPAIVHAKNNFKPLTLNIDCLTLFESQLRPQGAKHSKIKDFRFGGAGPEFGLKSKKPAALGAFDTIEDIARFKAKRERGK